MKTRILTAIAIILVAFPPLFFGGWMLQVLAVFIVAAACYEFLHALDGYDRWGWPITLIMIAWILGLGSIPQVWSQAYWIAAVIFFWSLPIFYASISEQDALSMVAFTLILGMCYLSIQLLIPQFRYLWTLCFATYGSDTGAYFAGRYFGRHKMNERISPKKTWEGFFGGWGGGFLLSFAMSFLYGGSLDSRVNLAICILAPVFAELGDLCFSAYKREHHLKDFSNILPGHGGILDRVDSLLMNILLFGILITVL